MDSKLVTLESVDISQLLSGDVAKLPPRNSPTMLPVVRKMLKPSKTSKTVKPIAGPFDPDLNLPITAIPASYWDCRATENSWDRAWRCVPQLLKFQMGMLSFLRGLASGWLDCSGVGRIRGSIRDFGVGKLFDPLPWCANGARAMARQGAIPWCKRLVR